MFTIRIQTLAAGLIGVTAFCAVSQAWAQQKYKIQGSPTSRSQYLQEHAIDVSDVAGHRLRVFEIRYDFPQHDYILAGVPVKEVFSRCMSDYVNLSGPFTCYEVTSLEDGNEVYSRTTGTSQSDGAGGLTLLTVQNFTGGTGKFKGIRGQVNGSGSRAPGAKSLSLQTSGEYWIAE
jgi:hypothetical protein